MANIAGQVRPGIAAIQPYVPGLTDDELKQLYGLRRVVKLNANENALGPSPEALMAIRDELNVLHHYPDGASALLRESIAEFHNLSAANVLVGNGSDDIIKLVSETFLEPGDEIVVPHPSFSQYSFGAAIMRARVVQVPLTDTFQYDIDAMLKAITPKTKLVYACSPNNPTGTIMTQSQAEQLLTGMPDDAILILDLAYNDFSVNPHRVMETELLLSDPRVVVLHTFSKLYGLAGLRVGYGLGHPELLNFVHRVREPFNVNRVAQRAAAAALTDGVHRDRSQAHAIESARYFSQEAVKLGVNAVPTEANFCLLEVGDGVHTMKSLMQQGIMVRAGFTGLEKYIRVTFGTHEENQEFFNALRMVKDANASL
jgi:histidinol-phosphate aminotransferase